MIHRPKARRHRRRGFGPGPGIALLSALGALITTLASAEIPAAHSLPEPSGPASISSSPAPDYEHPETRKLVTYVEAAAKAISERGEVVFADFRKKNGEWFRGDRYVFVMDIQGERYVYPPDPSNEKVNLMADVDLGGKPIGRMLVERAQEADGRGWVHYRWNRPGPDNRRPVWKSTYVVRTEAPSGRTYLVGSGLYEGPTERRFVVDEVDAAAALLEREGKAAFERLRDPTSRFTFRDTYVFINSPDGTEVVNPGFPELEGRNLMGLEDAEGKPMVRQYIKLALEKGSGWITYLWPQPDRSDLPVRKATYVRKVVLPDGQVMIVGAGIYEP